MRYFRYYPCIMHILIFPSKSWAKFGSFPKGRNQACCGHLTSTCEQWAWPIWSILRPRIQASGNSPPLPNSLLPHLGQALHSVSNFPQVIRH